MTNHAANVREAADALLAAVVNARAAGCHVNLPSYVEEALHAVSVSDMGFTPSPPEPQEAVTDAPSEAPVPPQPVPDEPLSEPASRARAGRFGRPKATTEED